MLKRIFPIRVNLGGYFEAVSDFRDLRTKLAVAFICLLVLYWPLIDVRYFFLDDIGRTYVGYYGFLGSGRPLADLLLIPVTLGGKLTDIAPAPQLLGVLSLAAAATLIASRLGVESPVAVGILAVAAGGSPYFLENMSFRYDSGFMALGVLCAVAPFSLTRMGGPMPIAAASVSLFASLCLYQTTVNCYPVIALYLSAQMLVTKPARKALAFGLACVIPLVIAVVVYWIFTKATVMLADPSYLQSRGEFASLDQALSKALVNFGSYATTAWQDWRRTPVGVVWVLIVGATCCVVAVRILRTQARSMADKVLSSALAVVLLLLTFPAAFLSQLFLERPEFASRTFTGVVALIAVFSASLLTVGAGLGGRLAKALVALQALALLGVAYTHANALHVQERYDDRTTAAIVQDIQELDPEGIWTFAISGWAGVSPMIERVFDTYPILRRGIFSLVYQDSYWAAMRFKSFGLWVQPAPPSQIDKREVICKTTPRRSNSRYDLHLVDKTVLIRFKNDGVKCA